MGGPDAVKKEPKVKQRKPSSPIIEMDPNEPAHPMPKHVVEALRLYEAEQAVVPDPLANPLGTGAVNLPVIDWNVWRMILGGIAHLVSFLRVTSSPTSSRHPTCLMLRPARTSFTRTFLPAYQHDTFLTCT